MVVVFPAPLGPSSPTISLRPTWDEMPSTATKSPYVLRGPVTESTGATGASEQRGDGGKMGTPIRYHMFRSAGITPCTRLRACGGGDHWDRRTWQRGLQSC